MKITKGSKNQQSKPPVQREKPARIDPRTSVVSEYQFYTVIQQDYKNAAANIPSTNWAARKRDLREVDQNNK